MPEVNRIDEARLAAELRQRAIESRRQNDRAVQGAVQQIQEIRREIETLAARLQEHAHDFRRRARRTPVEESSSHVVFANAHLRFAGAILQGLRRTASMDRVLETQRAEQREARRREEQETQQRQVYEHSRLVGQLQKPSDDSLVELYSEILEGEGVSHA